MLSTFAEGQKTLKENGKLAISLNTPIFSSEYDPFHVKVQNLKKKIMLLINQYIEIAILTKKCSF